MKKIILILLIFILIGCVWADDFSKITVHGVDFEIPQQYANGDTQKTKYIYQDLRTFAILCVDDYIISNYGGEYDISDSHKSLTINGRPAMLLTTYNKYIDKDVSYLYFPVNKSVYCICYQGNDVNESISHIVESAPESGITSDTFYGLLNEAHKEHQNREYLGTLSNDNSNYVTQTNEEHQNSRTDRLVQWYLLSH